MGIPKLLLIALLMRTASPAVQPERANPPKLDFRMALDRHQSTFLRGESISEMAVNITLANVGGQNATVTDFEVARLSGDLKVSIFGPKGEQDSQVGQLFVEQLDKPIIVQPMSKITTTLKLKHFGYDGLDHIGERVIQIEFKPRPESPALVAKSMKLVVIDIKESDILSTHVVQASKTTDDDVALIQQIVVDGKTWLYERIATRKDGKKAEPHRSTRLAQLPGKVVDLKVEGLYGSGEPLTITYRETTYTKWTTKHVINSVNGRPWTAEEEKRRRERLKKLAPVPEKK